MQAITVSKDTENGDFKGFYWATRIPCDKSGGAHKETVQIKDGLVMRTDGCRMHIFAPEADFENGLYTVARRTKKEIVLIPYVVDNKTEWEADWECVFPDRHRDYKEIEVAGYDHESVEFFTVCKAFDQVINFYYFADLIEDCDEGFQVIQYNDQDRYPIIFFDNNNKLAAIMPISK